MKKGEMLSRMLLIATTAHAGMFDQGGQPYILHPLKVMYYLKSDDEELQCIALGHDLFEDTNETPETLRAQGISERVILGILNLSKHEGQSYEDYKEQVKSNPDAIRVKMADLRHNSDIRRLKGVTDKDIKRTVKYHNFYLELQALV